MFGIHVVNAVNRDLYADALDQSHRLRHRIYIDELKWKGLTPRQDGREYDQFDTAEAFYLLAIDDGMVLGGTRLVPSIEPHLLSEVFPHLASVRGIPRGNEIAEWTRFYVAPERREEHKSSKVGSSILASLIDYALDEGITSISVVLNTFWLPRFLGYSWKVQPLGLPAVHDDEWLIAAVISVTPAALVNIRSNCGLSERSMLVRRGPQRPFISAGSRKLVA
jgi:acyl-homoserine lactone synthase